MRTTSISHATVMASFREGDRVRVRATVHDEHLVIHDPRFAEVHLLIQDPRFAGLTGTVVRLTVLFLAELQSMDELLGYLEANLLVIFQNGQRVVALVSDVERLDVLEHEQAPPPQRVGLDRRKEPVTAQRSNVSSPEAPVPAAAAAGESAGAWPG